MGVLENGTFIDWQGLGLDFTWKSNAEHNADKKLVNGELFDINFFSVPPDFDDLPEATSGGIFDIQLDNQGIGSEINNLPDAVDDSVATDEDSILSGSVFADNGNGADSDPDGDIFTVTEVNGKADDVDTSITLASGALLTLNADGSYSYDPNGAFEGLNNGDTALDSFTYTIDDGNGGTDTATVNITIDGVTDNDPPVIIDNNPPVAVDDSYTTEFETSLTIDLANGVLNNDTDDDSDPLTATLASGPANGIVTLNSDGSFTYTPNAGFSGTDTFTYNANDDTDNSNVTTVSITVAEASNPVIPNPVFERLNPIGGTTGNDGLIGTDDADLLEGLGGNDALEGKAGDDELNGGPGLVNAP